MYTTCCGSLACKCYSLQLLRSFTYCGHKLTCYSLILQYQSLLLYFEDLREIITNYNLEDGSANIGYMRRWEDMLTFDIPDHCNSQMAYRFTINFLACCLGTLS